MEGGRGSSDNCHSLYSGGGIVVKSYFLYLSVLSFFSLCLPFSVAIEYLERKHSERDAREKRIEQLKGEILRLNQSITTCQQQLPASGVLVPTRQVGATGSGRGLWV